MEYDLTSGDVPKRLKGPDSKSGRSVLPAHGFKSHHLRLNAIQAKRFRDTNPETVLPIA